MTRENAAHIKEIFEKKTGVSLTPARSAYRPVRRAVLTAAAVLCCLGVTAAANRLTNGALIRFFQDGGAYQAQLTPEGAAEPVSQPEPLSETQLLTIDRYTTPVGQSQTVGDTTVTLESVTAAATTHDLITFCVFTVEAPEGNWVEADNDILEFQRYYGVLKGDTTEYGTSSWLAVQDGPRDNVKTVVMTALHSAQGNNRQLQFQVTLENFRVCTGQEADEAYISKGIWNFNVALEPQPSISLLNQPVTLESGTMTLQSLELTPLGGSFTITDINLPVWDWQPERLVFSDGSSVDLSMGGGILDEANMLHYMSFTFAAPTDLTNAVAVEFADGTQISIP